MPYGTNPILFISIYFILLAVIGTAIGIVIYKIIKNLKNKK